MHHFPVLNFGQYSATMATVHLFTQIIGKIRLAYSPWINHSWHVTLYVSSRGMTTREISYKDCIFTIDFDFIDHHLKIIKSDGQTHQIPLKDCTIAGFYDDVRQIFSDIGVDVDIHEKPNEIDPAVAFRDDHQERTYDPEQANIIWQSLVAANAVLNDFRSSFIGKVSPVHFFWGSFDLAVTRFSGREAPPHPGGLPNMPLDVMQEAYSHEVSSAGLWFGSAELPEALFYSYCYPTPESFKDQKIGPEGAYYHEQMGEFVLPYKAVQNAQNPQEYLMEFLETTYAAAANSGGWARNILEKDFSSFNKK